MSPLSTLLTEKLRINVSVAQKEALRRLAAEQGRTPSDVLRRLIPVERPVTQVTR